MTPTTTERPVVIWDTPEEYRRRTILSVRAWLARRKAGEAQPLEFWESEACTYNPYSIEGLTVSERAELLRYDLPMTSESLASLRARQAKGERVPLGPLFGDSHSHYPGPSPTRSREVRFSFHATTRPEFDTNG